MNPPKGYQKFPWESCVGKRFNRLTVLKLAGKNKHGHQLFECKCDCGKVVVIEGTAVKNNRTRSCGCLQRDVVKKRCTIHGMTKTKLFGVWTTMNQRCSNPNTVSYDRYGAKGIYVCEEWKNDFVTFMNWSLKHGYRDGLSIDRIDNDKGYSPENCRWVNAYVQSNNRSNNRLMTLNGTTKNCKQWADYFGFNYKYFHEKCKKNDWNLEKVLEIPYFKNQIKEGAISCL